MLMGKGCNTEPWDTRATFPTSFEGERKWLGMTSPTLSYVVYSSSSSSSQQNPNV